MGTRVSHECEPGSSEIVSGVALEERVLVEAGDDDVDPAIGRRTPHVEATAEQHAEQANPAWSAHCLDLQGRSLAVDLIGYLTPILGKVEVLRPVNGIVGRCHG